MAFIYNKDEKSIKESLDIQLNEINDGLSRPIEIKSTKISKVGVLGSGLMGHGIAYVTALAGMRVVMIDTSQKNIDKGIDRINAILNESLVKGFISKEKNLTPAIRLSLWTTVIFILYLAYLYLYQF